MSDAALRALRTALAKGKPLDRVYYLHGDDDHRKELIVQQIIEKLVDPSMRDFNVEVRRGHELDAPTLAGLLDALPMLAARRVVVLRDVDALKKPARLALDSYLERAAEETILLLLSSSGVKLDAALAKAATAVAVEPFTEEELEKWLATTAEKAGATLEPAAAQLLAAAVGSDLALATGEIEKLVSYTRGAPITAAAINDVVGVRHGETMGDLLDAIGQRDVTRALKLLGPVLAHPKAGGVPILLALTAQTLALAWAKSKGGRADFFAFLKMGKALTGRSWTEAVTAWNAALPKWSLADLDRALRLLHAADRSLKDTRISTDEAILASLILAMATPTRPRRAA
jgi:DNA polymerase-3 subunit delta